MDIKCYTNKSDPKKISKSLTLVTTLSGHLVNISEVVNPVIVVEGTIPSFNYCQIEEFNRYYFVENIKSIRSNVFELHLRSDVLMSFNIDSVSGIVIETEAEGADNYIAARNWVAKVKDKTDIVVFPSGLLESGEYILITAGG